MVVNEYARALSAMNHLDSGCSRDIWVKIGMAAKSAGLSFDDFHCWSQTAANYKNEKDCRSAWESFKTSGGITAATLFGLARDNGWRDETDPQPIESKNHHVEFQSVPNTNAIDIWNRCLPAEPSHDYIVRKHGMSDGLRYYPSTQQPLIINNKNVANYLVVPCWDGEYLQTLQLVSPVPGEKKLNLFGVHFNRGCFVVGEIKRCVYICEGIGHAWSINKATGDGAVVCFTSSRMLIVAKAVRAKYPEANLIIVSDRGKEKQASDIALAVNAKWIELPQNKPSNYDVNDYALEYGCNALVDLLVHLKSPETRYKLLSCADLLNAPPMRWLVYGVLPASGLAALYGPSGSGKSFLTLDVAFAIANGDASWFGLSICHAHVTYVCLEGEAGLAKRLKACGKFHAKSVPQSLKFVTQPFDFLIDEDIRELSERINASMVANGIVIIDTLNRAANGIDENSSKDMGKVISGAKKLQSLVGGLVLLVHHTGKDTGKGMRGHSSLYAALDGAIEVVRNDKHRSWCVAKSKDEVTGDSYPFKLEVVRLGFDELGNEITSCAVAFDGSVHVPEKIISLGSNQKIAFDKIKMLLNDSSHVGIDGAPPNVKCVVYDDAVSLISEFIPTDAKHKKSRAKTAISGLIERGRLSMKGNYLWQL